MDPLVATNVVKPGDPQTVRPADQKKDAGTLINSNFETFLNLLTTQLKNQDPQSPMDSSQFAAQLATFSGVEQQVQTNTLLKDLVSRSQSVGLSDLAGWVGMEARAPAHLHFDGTALELTPPMIDNVDRAVLVVTGSDGTEAGQVDIRNDGKPITWLGTGNDGTALPPGDYTFAVRGYRGDSPVGTLPLESWGKVTEVQQGSDGPMLVLDSGARLKAADVTAVRTPTS